MAAEGKLKLPKSGSRACRLCGVTFSGRRPLPSIERLNGGPKCPPAKSEFNSRSMCRFVALDVEMFDRERSIMRRHLFVVMFRDRIGRSFGAALEHLSLFLEQFGLRHRALRSDQAGDVENGGADHGTDGPEGGIPAFPMGAVVFEGRHDKASNLVGASTAPVCFRTTTPETQNGFVGRLSAPNLVIGLRGQFDRPERTAAPPELPCLQKALLGKGLG